jgi:hypothetical protein
MIMRGCVSRSMKIVATLALRYGWTACNHHAPNVEPRDYLEKAFSDMARKKMSETFASLDSVQLELPRYPWPSTMRTAPFSSFSCGNGSSAWVVGHRRTRLRLQRGKEARASSRRKDPH